MKKLFVSIILMLLPMVASAYGDRIDGIGYDFNPETEEATVVRFGYTDYNSFWSVSYRGAVIIPNEVIYNGVTYTVTNIEDNTFLNCTSVNSIELPNTITTIGKSAFQGCI